MNQLLSDICEMHLDSTGDQTLETVIEATWIPCKENSLTRGYTSDVLWVKFSIHNSLSHQEIRYLYFHTPWLNNIEAFQDGQKIQTASASTQTFEQRGIPTVGFTFPLSIPAQTTSHFVFRIASEDPLIGYANLVSLDELVNISSQIQMFAGLLIGGILIISFYNLVIFSLVHDSTYLYYVLYTFSTLLLSGSIYGFGYQFLWSSSPELNFILNSATSGIAFLTLLIFLRTFLATQRNLPKIDQLLKILIGVAIAQIVVSFAPVPHGYGVTIATVLALVGTPFVLIYAWRQRLPSSGFLLIAYSSSLGGVAVFSLPLFGLVEFNLIIYRWFGLGTLVEIVLFSFALADKIRILRDNASRAQREALAAQIELTQGLTNAKLNLEHQVLERTEALNEAKLSAEKLAMTDELTRLNNRRAFFRFTEALHADAVRHNVPYCIIMIDIDRFKLINDNHGHATGDQVIQAAALSLLGSVRMTDICGRLGGEEFAVFLPHTEIPYAQNFASRLRENLKALTVKTPQGDIQFTSSFGIAQFRNDGESLDEVIANADEALYSAKEHGRDRVMAF